MAITGQTFIVAYACSRFSWMFVVLARTFPFSPGAPVLAINVNAPLVFFSVRFNSLKTRIWLLYFNLSLVFSISYSISKVGPFTCPFSNASDVTTYCCTGFDSTKIRLLHCPCKKRFGLLDVPASTPSRSNQEDWPHQPSRKKWLRTT